MPATFQPRLTRLSRFFASRHFVTVGMAAGVTALALSSAAIAVLDAPAAEAAGGPAAAARPPAAVAATAVPTLTVHAVQPVVTTFSRAIGASGTVHARDELVVGSDVAGVRVVEVKVDVGSTVQAGQLLARADDAQLQAQRAQQTAQIRQALADLIQAQANLERAVSVADAGVYSQEAIETRRTAAIAAQARLDLARAQLSELDLRIARTRIVAPAAGIVAARTVTLGAVVQNGSELFRLIKDGQLEWRAELPAHALARVRPGDPAQVRRDDGSVVEGRVRLVAPTIDAATRNGLVHVSLPPGAGLKAGGHAKGEIVTGQEQVTAVPEAAVLTRDGFAFVYVIGEDGIARMTRVDTGERRQGLVEVRAGLDAGLRVVTTGAGFVKDGDRLHVAPEGAGRLAGAAR